MRFICCDLENTSWEDDVDPRHFITVRQAPPAVDPKQAPQSLLSLTVHTHRHTHMHVPSFSPHNHAGGCARVHTASPTLSLQLSFFSAPSITHERTKPDMDFDEKQTVWLSVRRQPAIILVGSVMFLGMFSGRFTHRNTLNVTR